jgi:type III secretory pathway lipoprotein EscJ
MKKIMLSLAAAVILTCTACSQNDVVTSLQLSVDAASVALPIVAQSAGITPALENQLEAYLQATNTAISQASTILAGTGTPQQKSAAIVAAFSTDAVPVMPAGTPLAVVQAIQAVSQDVAKFLQTTAAPAPAAAVFGGKTPKAVKIDAGTVAKLEKIKAKAEASLVAIKSKHAK